MEQVGGGGRGRVEQMGSVQQQQDRRVKPSAGENQQQPPQQPQKCPRCESLNTKFCYYNNYSLSQPRYFCKTCRRYWTQGGTLRNVPVGGGCRKGKRSKRPSSADQNPSIRSSTAISASATASINTAVISTTTGETDLIMAAASSNPIPSMVSAPSSSVYYGGGGFLSSLATLQSFNPSMNVGGDFGGSNLALLQGFGLPSFNPQQQQQVQQSQVFHMGNRETKPLQVFAPEENVIQGSSNTRPSTSHQNWPQSFIEASNSKSESTYWTSSANNNNNNNTTTTTTNNNNNTASGSPLWLSDLPGYGHSSQPFL